MKIDNFIFLKNHLLHELSIMSELYIYNTYSHQKEKFEPLTKDHVGMYVCGPTVNGESHLGHARPYVTFDVVYRYLLHLGYKVRYVRNITDAGHFEEEGRTDEDRIGIKAALEKLEPMELVQKYTYIFHWVMQQLNCLPPSIEPTATGHIIEQITMIEKIIEEGYAYVVNGSVYFDIKKYAKTYPYGKLSGRVIEEMLQTTRALEAQDEKQDKADFALWKAAPPKHIMRWKSPWGEGFPGWHIECSAMSTKYLGKQFDIHGGGMDLQFPHHESEIAQSTICNHQTPVRYWMHNNMITINGKRMGRSHNNIIKLTELFNGSHHLLDKAYSPMTIRFFILQTHYTSTLDFSNEGLQASEKGFKRLWEAYQYLQKNIILSEVEGLLPNNDIIHKIQTSLQEMDVFMNDDFSTAKVLANMFELVPIINSIKDKHIALSAFPTSLIQEWKNRWKLYMEDILGFCEEQKKDDKLDSVLQLLINMRKEARAKKDFATSDIIRNQLQNIGVLLKDEKDGSMSYTLE